jgi:hypothetical protein
MHGSMPISLLCDLQRMGKELSDPARKEILGS